MCRRSVGQRGAGLAAAATALAAGVLALALGGCGTGRPAPLGASLIEQARQFEYFRIYWDGRVFQRVPLTNADGRENYLRQQGTGVYYGDCERGRGFLGTGSCTLPLQVQTVWFGPCQAKPAPGALLSSRYNSDSALGKQFNTVIRRVPAVVYDSGKSIELFSGDVAINIYADSPARARTAADALRPLNTGGSPGEPLPPPHVIPGLTGPGRLAVIAYARSVGAVAPRVCPPKH